MVEVRVLRVVENKVSVVTTVAVRSIAVTADLFLCEIKTTGGRRDGETLYRFYDATEHEKLMSCGYAANSGHFVATMVVQRGMAKNAQYDWQREHPTEVGNSKSIFNRLLSGEIDPQRCVVEYNAGNSSMRRLDGTFVPRAIHYSYLYGNFSNYHYDMVKAVDILSARRDIIFDGEDGPYMASGTGHPNIKNIPSYNVDTTKGIYHHVPFTWTPSEQLYQRLVDERGHIKETTPFEMDVFGLRAGGAALRDTYYG